MLSNESIETNDATGEARAIAWNGNDKIVGEWRESIEEARADFDALEASAKREDMARDAEAKHELRRRIAQLGKRSRQLDESWNNMQESMRELENEAARVDAELDGVSAQLLALDPDCELEAIMYGAV